MSSDMAFASFAPSAVTISAMMSVSALTTPKPLRASGSISSSVSTPTCRSLPVQHDMTTPRARARAARLRANEAAERQEDQAALITTPAQWALLRRSFVGVKTEFTDLDGLSWNVSPQVSAGAVPRTHTHTLKVCASASAPVITLDDKTVRASQRRKQRLPVSVGG
ncbi:hypothetical protein B0F90DRAFT_1726427 [Multifurca ochricompacta]|uniref:Uncharacterized protein n=1 Tax=Multifurca ochricompacta TaxID=376703 RepID=A0AAD4M3C0_9AGAM|nr:hypothetical protein B0F90DRAFT_1726427 [Multifurca ochricompacta]